MNTKEKYIIKLLREYARSENDIPLCPDEAVLIIMLLKRGEAYEKMWGELLNETSYLDRGSDTLNSMYDLKQKYFPRETNK